MARRKRVEEEETPQGVQSEIAAPPRYVAVRVPQFHPFQRVAIPTGAPGVMLEMDSWLDCQIKAGIVKEVQ